MYELNIKKLPVFLNIVSKERGRCERQEAHEARLKRIMMERWHKRQEEVGPDGLRRMEMVAGKTDR